MEEQETQSGTRTCGPWLDALVLVVLVALGSWIRLDTAARDGVLTRADEQGLMKSDPGLLFYLTKEVANAEGLVPGSWEANPRIAHPGTVDVPADYTVGQEFLFGWTWRLFGEGTSLLRWCHVGSAILAALTALGVWGLARELCRSRAAALSAALLYLLLPASYRTIGFVLIREDLGLPLLAMHLWLAARALRLGTRTSVVLAAIAACLALATWHAMSFVLAIEAAAILAIYLRHGPPRTGGYLAVVIGSLALTWLLVPAVGGSALLAVILLLTCIGVGPLLRPRQPRMASLALLLVIATAGALWPGTGHSDFSHVYEVLLAKLLHGGSLPLDPAELSFDARLLWQGPFATLAPEAAFLVLGLALILAIPTLLVALGSESILPFGLGVFTSVSLFASWLVYRVSAIPAILLPPLIVYAYLWARTKLQTASPRPASDKEPRGLAELAKRALPVAAILGLLWQAESFHSWRTNYRLAWYRPEVHTREIAEMIAAVQRLVPADAAIAADFMNSTAILAWTDNPVVLQPKWERDAARRRVESFWSSLYGGSPEELRSLLVDELHCRYLVIDRETLWVLNPSRYCAGLPLDQARPTPGTAAASLLAEDPTSIEAQLPGFELIWSSLRTDGKPPGPAFRLYRLAEASH